VGALALFLFFRTSPSQVLGEKIELGVLANNNVRNGRAFIKVPFVKGEEATSLINAALDINGSGIFEEGEWVVKNMPALPRVDWNNSFYFTLGLPLQGEKRIRVVLSDFPLTESMWLAEPLPAGRQFIDAVIEPKHHEIGAFATDESGITASGTVRLIFSDPTTGEPMGENIVTVNRLDERAGQTYIDVEDPATPEGTDTYEVSGNVITNYGPFEGLVKILFPELVEG